MMVLKEMMMIIIRKHFSSLKESCWSLGEGSEVEEEEGSKLLR